MNKKVVLWGLFLSAFWALTAPLFAFHVELRNVSDNNKATKVDFGINKGSGYTLAQQYLYLTFSEEEFKEINIYTDNTDWAGLANEDRSGLISAVTRRDRIPLYWNGYSSRQAMAIPSFVSNISSWNLMLDKNNLDYEEKKASAKYIVPKDGVTYLYLGSLLPEITVSGAYKASLKIELASPDGKAPVIRFNPFDPSTIMLAKQLSFDATVEDDTIVRSATLWYRFEGDVEFSSKTMILVQSPINPNRYEAQVTLDFLQKRSGTLEYYMEVSDGFNRTFHGSKATPWKLKIGNEDEELSKELSGNGGSFSITDGNSKTKIIDIKLPPGSIRNSMKLTAKKMNPQRLPRSGGYSAVTSYEFGPLGLQFDRPITLSLAYNDLNQDGFVDENGVAEKSLKLFWYDGFEWRNMGGQVNELSNTVTTEVSHFSIYGLLPAGAPAEDDLRPKEKIITPNGDGINDFAQFGITADSEVKIYNVMGREIRKIQGVTIWDGRDDSGEVVKSGVYIYRIKSSGMDVSGTLGVAR